jgi:plastocyanin
MCFKIARRLVAGAMVTLAMLVAAPPPSLADDAIVRIDNFAFTPDVLTVKAGTHVVFVNQDDIPHTVVADRAEFRSKALDTDDRFEFTFVKEGEFSYFCGLHPHMRGRIVVTP